MDHSCNQCNKIYKSYQSLWNHNKKFHNKNVVVCGVNEVVCGENEVVLNTTKNKYVCNNCNKIFNDRSNKYKHEKICKNKNNENIKIKELMLQIKKQETKILQYKLKIQKTNSVDNMSVNKLNKLLTVRNNLIKNSNIHSNNNNTIQNNIVNNNFQLVGFGKEEVVDLLTKQEKKQIINAKYSCLEKLVEITHCGKYNQYKNILITNMKDQYMYKYDDVKGHFILVNKKDVLDSLIDNRVVDLETIYDDVNNTNNINNKTKEIIENVIEKINNTDQKYSNENFNKTFENYKEYKMDEIKVLLFNNRNKMMEDVSIILTAEQILND
jgi:hypothetical protein